MLLWGSLEPDGPSVLGQQAIGVGRGDQSSSGRQDAVLMLDQKSVEDLQLHLAEILLPMKGEDFWELHPGLRFDQPVQLEEWDLHSIRQQTPHRGFSRSSEAQQGDQSFVGGRGGIADQEIASSHSQRLRRPDQAGDGDVGPAAFHVGDESLREPADSRQLANAPFPRLAQRAHRSAQISKHRAGRPVDALGRPSTYLSLESRSFQFQGYAVYFISLQNTRTILLETEDRIRYH